jgi:hypothetical protein
MSSIKEQLNFIVHAEAHGNKDDIEFAKYLRWNILKGIIITNGFVFLFYATRFKNYRNSYLLYSKHILTLLPLMLLGNIMATCLGICSASFGLTPVFTAYKFNKIIPK